MLYLKKNSQYIHTKNDKQTSAKLANLNLYFQWQDKHFEKLYIFKENRSTIQKIIVLFKHFIHMLVIFMSILSFDINIKTFSRTLK